MKNIILLFLGIVIALASIEILLQTSSFVLEQASKFENSRKIKVSGNKDAIRIMCIGESTTFAQYPKQLVDYLNRRIKRDFIVIDCGVPGTNVENIAGRIEGQLKTYNPDIVISMMGANDAGIKDGVEVYKKYRLKTVSLFMLIKRNIEDLAAKKLHAEQPTRDYSKITDSYFFTKEPPQKLIDFIEKNPSDLKAAESLVCIYRMRQDYSNVEKYAKLFFENGGDLANASVPFMLTDVYIQREKYDKAEKMILSVINAADLTDEQKNGYLEKTVESYLSFAGLKELKGYYETITAAKIQTSILDDLYAYLTAGHTDVKYYGYPNKFKNQKLALNFDTERIKNAYTAFAKKVTNSGAVYICMSYPTLTAEVFKSFFKGTALKNKIIFVSNEKNFKEKLETEPYFKLFKDNFGITFGHCTDEGNALIAENAGNAILEILN